MCFTLGERFRYIQQHVVLTFDMPLEASPHPALLANMHLHGLKVRDTTNRPDAGMNILVCTPGRLLQHMDETPGFDAGQIQALILDEADRILDMGFAATLNAILENLPTERQTMLFSATQTKSVKDLARLSLDSPEYIAVHAEAAMPTPVKLQQVALSSPPVCMQLRMLQASERKACTCNPVLDLVEVF